MALSILKREIEDRGWSLLKRPVVPTPADELVLTALQAQTDLFAATTQVMTEVVEVARFNMLRMMFLGRNIDNSTATAHFYGWYKNGPAHYIGSSTITLGTFIPEPSDATGNLSFLFSPQMSPAVRAAFPELGMNSVVNGTFFADQNWTKGTGWTIAAGVATKATTVAASVLSQTTAPLTGGVTYRVKFTISGYSGTGTIKATVGTLNDGTARSGNGTYTEDIKVTAGSGFKFTATGTDTADFIGSIDDVSVVAIYYTGPIQQWRVADTFVITNNEGATVLTKAEIANDVSYLQLDLTNSQYQYLGMRVNYDGAIPMTQLGAIYVPISYKDNLESLRVSA